MKQRKNIVLILVFVFLFPIFVQAKIADDTSCKQIDSETLECQFKFKSTENTKNYNTIGIHLTLENMVLEKIKLNSGWHIRENSNNFISMETSKDMLSTNFSVGIATFKKIKWAEDCHVKASFDFGKIDRSCTIFDGNYYDSKGNITNAINYQKECEKPVCKIYPDGTYSDTKGNIVSKLEYEKDCQKHICKILEDGTKYGMNGTIVNDLTYEKECEKPVCKIYPDGTYSDTKGNIVSKLEYEKDCQKHICKILEDGTKYGMNGTIVNDLTYEKECEKPVCKIYPDGTYSDTKGNIVDQIIYEQECIKKVCIIVDNIKYGKNGEIVDDITYQKECQKHYCEILNDGTKYGMNGNIVNDFVYNKECVTKEISNENINNPQTGSSINVFLLIIGSIIGVVCYIIYKKGNKIHRL